MVTVIVEELIISEQDTKLQHASFYQTEHDPVSQSVREIVIYQDKWLAA